MGESDTLTKKHNVMHTALKLRARRRSISLLNPLYGFGLRKLIIFTPIFAVIRALAKKLSYSFLGSCLSSVVLFISESTLGEIRRADPSSQHKRSFCWHAKTMFRTRTLWAGLCSPTHLQINVQQTFGPVTQRHSSNRSSDDLPFMTGS